MGVGAIIGGVGSLLSAGIGAAGQAGLFGGGGGGIKPTDPKFKMASLPAPTTGLADYISQGPSIPGAQATATAADTASNQAYQQMLLSVDPNLINQTKTISNLANQYLQGIIPQDVQDQIQRATAQQAMTGGYGATSGMGRNLTTRDLGLTSLQLQQTGIGMAQTAGSMAQVLNPSFTPVSSLLMAPSALLQRQDQLAYYNTDVYNQGRAIKAGGQYASQAPTGSNVGGAISSGINQFFGSSGTTGKSPFQGLISGIQHVASNNNANPNFNLSWADQAAQDAGYSSYQAMQNAGAV